MGKFNRNQSDRERLGKCIICLKYIPVEYYFNEGDHLTCYECGTEYILISKDPVKLAMWDDYVEDDYFGEIVFDD